jgi:hypothetical protein
MQNKLVGKSKWGSAADEFGADRPAAMGESQGEYWVKPTPDLPRSGRRRSAGPWQIGDTNSAHRPLWLDGWVKSRSLLHLLLQAVFLLPVSIIDFSSINCILSIFHFYSIPSITVTDPWSQYPPPPVEIKQTNIYDLYDVHEEIGTGAFGVVHRRAIRW